MQSLQKFLEILCENSKIHICIHDVSGILKNEKMDFRYRMHSKRFCNAAKSTQVGLNACMRCKMMSNKYGRETGKAFSGECIYGVYELGVPLVVGGEVKCIIYVGNCCSDRGVIEKRIRRTCRLTGVDEERLIAQIDTLAPADEEKCRAIADIVGWYILSLPQKTERTGELHWAVESIKEYTDAHYSGNLSLKKVAALYYINEKYIGRLFKSQVGMSFRQYLKLIRLEKAAQMLKNTNNSVNDIALDTGFSDVAYFDRVFFEEYKKTPTDFRRC